jgi:hypothetical protein
MHGIRRIARKTIALSAVVVLGATAGAASAVAAEQTLPGGVGVSSPTSGSGASASTSSGETQPLSGTSSAGAALPALVPALPSLTQAPTASALPTVPEMPPPAGDPIPAPEVPVKAPTPQPTSRVVSQAAGGGRLPRDHRLGRGAVSGRRARGGRVEPGTQRRGEHRPAQRRGPRRGNIRHAAGAHAAAIGNHAFQTFPLSRFDRLGTAPDYPAPSQLLGSFGDGSSIEFGWALQLLAVMLLIGLGGFVRTARLF